ncbi:hypothetical protein BDP27DRAFT_1385002 [Rhodocollybia butyracea]|uniref:Uncharacterized protein n=1 Tax=Rhodocollybia butyracea TaxID=206335 RepID=A0A9P5U109_9AGAR|nr:hypothetical protein BDP27DRAFT_1385002 [Rhodocollybia butyracea]
MSKLDFVVVPLSGIDQNVVHNVGITFGYVVKAVDVAALQKAAQHTADKWRLLAGRVEWDAARKTYQVRVPVSKSLPEDYASIKFTTTEFPSFSLNLTSLDEDSRQILDRPPLKYFRARTTPSSLNAYAAKRFPLMAIHVSLLQNCTCVGISFPHGVFDAIGMAWQSAGASQFNDGACSSNNHELLSLWLSIAFEMLWHRSTTRAVHLGPRTVEHIMVRMTKESEESGKPLVSKGDMLIAWLLKISINSVFSMRQILSEINPEFEQYPHNAYTPIALPLIDIRSLSSMSLYELALLIGWGIVPLRRRKLDSWLFSNQVLSGIETLDLGSGQLGLWFWGTPVLPDHSVTINKFRDGGYLVEACVRASRWRAIEKALERMEGGLDPFV